MVNQTWDKQLYVEGKSVVDDESDLVRLLMSGANLADEHAATSSAQLLVDGQVVAGGAKPSLPEEYFVLPIPTRPRWTRAMTKSQLTDLEQSVFVTWRRKLAHIEDAYDAVMTPYERSPFFWRQLWRVVERGDVVVQVIDARDPLLYRSTPLEDFVETCADLGGASSDGDGSTSTATSHMDPDMGFDMDFSKLGVGGGSKVPKVNVILLNKADLVPESVREEWAHYWSAQGVHFFFFSAIQKEEEEQGGGDEEALTPHRWSKKAVELREAERQPAVALAEEEEERGQNETVAEEEGGTEGGGGRDKILSPEELLERLRELGEERRERMLQLRKGGASAEGGAEGKGDATAKNRTRRVTISFVGFPNVGKSSVLNALTSGFDGVKRVAQAASPGKTKHLQTLLVGEELVLCDCPGLVFPSVVSSRSEMMCAGILNVHAVRDAITPVQLICDSVPKETVEGLYGIAVKAKKVVKEVSRDPLDFMRAARLERLGGVEGGYGTVTVQDTYEARDLLRAYCVKRSMVQQNSGNADFNRAARVILTDYINGRIPHWRLPPEIY